MCLKFGNKSPKHCVHYVATPKLNIAWAEQKHNMKKVNFVLMVNIIFPIFLEFLFVHWPVDFSNSGEVLAFEDRLDKVILCVVFDNTTKIWAFPRSESFYFWLIYVSLTAFGEESYEIPRIQNFANLIFGKLCFARHLSPNIREKRDVW